MKPSRTWRTGTKAKNNGVLFLVAPKDRKIRIEVGYGLEGALTDAVTAVIIRTAVAPRFKAGDFAGGMAAGTDAILTVLSGDAEEWNRRAAAPADGADGSDLLALLFMVLVFAILFWTFWREVRGGSRSHRTRSGIWLPAPSGSGWSGGWGGGSSGGFSGGGFSGGGGSSGGGGASGSW